jgi:hypothetical protein
MLKFNFLLLVFCVLLSQCGPKVNSQERLNALAQLSRGGEEENHKAKKKWETMRYADPATGAIPANAKALDRAFIFENFRNNAAAKMGFADTVAWRSRGPWNVGGRTRAFAIDATDEQVYIAGGVSGGLWRSVDAGNSWARVGSTLIHPGVVSIAQDRRPGFTNIWYALSGEISGTSASADGAFYLGDGLMKSTDGGITWAYIANTATGAAASFSTQWQGGWRVVVNPTNGDVLVAQYGTIRRSVDGGATWLAELGSIDGGYYTDVAVSDSGVCYAYLSYDGTGAVAKGMYRSPDGNVWTKIQPNTGWALQHDRYVIEIDPNNSNTVYFLGVNNDSIGHVSASYLGDKEYHGFWKYNYLSGDGDSSGGAFTDLSMSLPNNPATQFDKFYAQGGYDLCVKVQPGNSNNVFVGGTNSYRSTNAFADATQVTQIGGYGIGTSVPMFTLYPVHHPDQHGFAFQPSNPNKMINYNDGGIYKTEDCLASNVSWDKLDRGYLTTQFYTIALDEYHSNNTLIGGLQDNGTFWTLMGSSTSPWTMPFNGDGSYCDLDNDGTYYMSRQQGAMIKAHIDATGTITDFNRIDPICGVERDEYLWMNPFIINPLNNNNMVWIAKNRLWLNTNLNAIPTYAAGAFDSISTNWQLLGDTVPYANGIYTCLAMTENLNDANRLYVGTDKRKLMRIDNVGAASPVVTDITADTIATDGVTFPVNGYLCDIAVDPKDGNHLMVIFSNYGVYSAFASRNGGDNWFRCAGNLETDIAGTGSGPSLRCAAICPTTQGHRYYIGSSVGVFSTDTLTSATVWVQESPGTIGEAVISMFDYREMDGALVVATHGNGTFQANLPAPLSPAALPELSIEASIYPNPTADYINIETPANINSISIMSMNGNAITTQENTTKIDVSKLAVGVYFMVINTSEGKAIKRFVKQ